MPTKIRTRDLRPEQQLELDRVKQAVLSSLEPAEIPPVNTATDTLRSRREALNLRTEDVCALVEIAHSSLRNYESGRTTPQFPPEILSYFLTAYRISFEEFRCLVANTLAAAEKNGTADSWRLNQERQAARKRAERAAAVSS